MANISSISSYQQVDSAWKNSKTNEQVNKTKSEEKTKASEWNPITSTSSLVPTQKEGYGTVIGDVSLSEKAQEYYKELKGKFSGMDFILVSKDLKSQVAANASSYGNSSKPLVLIDDEKLERMANDESYRKKYEGLIAMAEAKLQQAKNSLTSSGASVKNYGVNIDENGNTSFFATIEKMNEAQAKRIQEKREERIKERREEKKEERAEENEERIENLQEKEYIQFNSSSLDELISMVSKYAYDNTSKNVMTEAESSLGQNIDFKG